MAADLLAHAIQLASDNPEIAAMLVCGHAVSDADVRRMPRNITLINLVPGPSSMAVSRRGDLHIVHVSHLPATREGQIRLGMLLSLSHGLIQPRHTVVSVAGQADASSVDTMMLVQTGAMRPTCPTGQSYWTCSWTGWLMMRDRPALKHAWRRKSSSWFATARRSSAW